MARTDNRTGVFFCNCEGKFTDSLDFKAIKKQLQLCSGEIVQEVPGLCKEEGQAQLSMSIGAATLNGLVIAGCREDRLNKQCLHTAGQHGIGQEKLAFINLQDLCVNVHQPGEKLNQKVAHLTQQSLVKQRLQQQVLVKKIAVSPQVLVIGDGPIAETVIKEITSNQPVAVLGAMHGEKIPGATYYEGHSLLRVTGNTGNFSVTLRGGQVKTVLQVGGIVLALETPKLMDPSLGLTQEREILPLSRFSTDLEQDWSTKTVAFLLGDGENQALDSSAQVLQQATDLRQKYGARVEFFYKQLQVAGEGLDNNYRLARQAGVKFTRYAGPIDVHTNVLGVTLKYCDPLLPSFKSNRILLDYLVCGESYQPSPKGMELAKLLQVDLGSNGFFQQDNVHLLPSTSNRDGIYFVGLCHHPIHALDIVTQAQFVAAKVARFASGVVSISQLQPIVDPEKCSLCLTCYRTCSKRAVDIDYEQQSVIINPLACQLCGTCAAECPAKAIELPGYFDRQIVAQLQHTGKIVAFACENSGHPAAELAGLLNRQYPVSVELVKVPCAGKIDALYILQALERGADGVLLLACHREGCKSLQGNFRAEARLTRVKELVSVAGIAPERVHLINLAANTGHKFVGAVIKWLKGLEPIDGEGDGN
jgi:coenzyme F420-reducing hydrogenase delta subunit/Pyruvate/2-oxoacid:ferredoxin oxidoreductase delta subunit